MARLPQPGTDDGIWGDILNEYLLDQHNADGTHKTATLLAAPAEPGQIMVSDPDAAQGFSWQTTDFLMPQDGVSEQVLMRVSDDVNECEWRDVTKETIGLGNVSNDLQLRAEDLDTDPLLTANSDLKVASQKAVKTYATATYLPKAGGTVSGRLFVSTPVSTTGEVGLTIDKTFSPTAHTANRAWGMQFKQYTASSFNFTDSNGIVGFEGFASHNGTGTVQAMAGSLVYAKNSSSGTVQNLTGMLAYGNQNLGTGTVVDSYGVKINSPYLTGGSITNNYGLYIDSHTQGTGANYALYTNSGQVRFGDTVIFGGGIIKRRTTVNDASYTVAVNDYIISYTALTATRTITLPTATVGKIYVIKDEIGKAATYPIVVTATGGTIEGVATKAITTNFGWLKLYYNGTNWYIIS